jgi:hypothetical protein
VIVALDICELVMFPVIAMLTVAPLAIDAGTVVVNGVTVGDDVDNGIGVGVGVGLGVGVGAGDGVPVGEGDGVGVGANVAKMVYAACTLLKV